MILKINRNFYKIIYKKIIIEISYLQQEYQIAEVRFDIILFLFFFLASLGVSHS